MDKTLRSGMSKKILWLLLVVVFFGTALRVATLRQESVDGDELFSRRVAIVPLRSAFETARNDLVHPPLYYLVLKVGTSIWGASALGIRLWSLVFGAATLVVVAAIGATLPGARYGGILAAAMLALNRELVFYSQQARSYSLYTLLVVLLVLWVSAVARNGERQKTWLWVAGYFLMVALVYTHYVAAVYVLFAVCSLLVSKLPSKVKILAITISVGAAFTFVPWLLAIAEVYRLKHGVGANLDWQGHPSVYDLKAIFASAIGVMEFKGATTLALILVVILSISALSLSPQGRSVRESPTLLVLFSLATVPPFIIFALSTRPFYLPLFGVRHLLPSVALMGLLCCHGVEVLAGHSRHFHRHIFAAGALVVLIMAGTPTLVNMAHGSSRFPYNSIARDVRFQIGVGRRVYTTWFYGIGEPVNFYCGATCVQPLTKEAALPDSIVLLYRPNVPTESQSYRNLLNKEGFTTVSDSYYTNGGHSTFGTSMAILRRTQ